MTTKSQQKYGGYFKPAETAPAINQENVLVEIDKMVEHFAKACRSFATTKLTIPNTVRGTLLDTEIQMHRLRRRIRINNKYFFKNKLKSR